MANGDNYTYDHPDGTGYGEMAKGSPLTAEMAELDLKSGSVVTLLATDEDSGSPIIEWTDAVNINRITTVEPDTFDEYFNIVGSDSKAKVKK